MRFTFLEKNKFYYQTRTIHTISCAVIFYNVGVVTQGRRIGSWWQFSWTFFWSGLDSFCRRTCRPASTSRSPNTRWTSTTSTSASGTRQVLGSPQFSPKSSKDYRVRAAVLFLAQHTNTGKNDHILQQIAVKCTKLLQNVPNCSKICQIASKYAQLPKIYTKLILIIMFMY
jgi:hypothetical protein